MPPKAPRSVVLVEPIGALAHLGLTRAYTLQGDTAKARIAYQPAAQLTAEDVDPPIEELMLQEDGHFSVTWRRR